MHARGIFTAASLRGRLGALALAALIGAPAGAAEAPPSVLDPHYGEVLYHFHQSDYLGAITRLQAAQATGRVPHHAEEAELMLGGLLAAYGLQADAEAIFRRLLAEPVPEPVRDRAWLQLARLAYQRGQAADAEALLSRMSDNGPPARLGERQLMRALALLAQNKPAEAAVALEPWQGEPAGAGYARYNRAVALLRAGDTTAATTLLDQLGQAPGADAESWALRDKANLVLGFQWLQREQPAPARAALQRVRLDSPFAPRALLGLGLAEIGLQQPLAALTPLQPLAERPAHEAAAREARLALPYLYARLGDKARAAALYENAIAGFETEDTRLQQALAQTNDGELLAALLKGVPAPGQAYLPELLASHSLQQSLKDYRELLALKAQLARWSEALPSFDAMLDAREARYAQVLPRLEKALADVDLPALDARRGTLENEYAAIDAADDALALADAEQAELWRMVNEADERLAGLSVEADPDGELRQRVDLLKGRLLWELEQAYPDRRWQARKALNGLGAELERLRAQHTRLTQAQPTAAAGFGGYRERIDAQRGVLAALAAQADAALADQAGQIGAQVGAALVERRQALAEQLAHARFALAKLYDAANGSGAAQ